MVPAPVVFEGEHTGTAGRVPPSGVDHCREEVGGETGNGTCYSFIEQKPKLNKDSSHKQDHCNRRHDESLSSDIAVTTFVYLWETQGKTGSV